MYGDANSRNLLFTPSGSPSIYVIDCDGIRIEGDPTLAFRTTASWGDPYSPDRVSLQSDRYAFGLWVLRILTAEMARPSGNAFDLDRLPQELPERRELQSLLRQALDAPGSRPAPGEFLPVLEQMASRST